MKILILDERHGNAMTPEIEDKIDDADIHMTIAPDSKVVVHVSEGSELYSFAHAADEDPVEAEFEAEFVVMPHRDELSGAKSAAGYDKIEQARIQSEKDNPPEDPLVKAGRAWEGPSNSGTETIKEM